MVVATAVSPSPCVGSEETFIEDVDKKGAHIQAQKDKLAGTGVPVSED